MPKGHPRPQPGAPLRHHARTSSGGSSKHNLHLHFTQKDGLTPHKHHHDQRTKRSSVLHESHANMLSRSRSPSPIPHPAVGTASQFLPPTRSKDHLSLHHYAPAPSDPHLHVKHNGGKSKADFTLASPITDDDDWVSENGDQQASDAKRAPTTVEQPVHAVQDKSTFKDGLPRPETPLTRVSTARPTSISTDPPNAVSNINHDTPYSPIGSTANDNHQHHRQHHHNHYNQARPRHDPAKRHSTSRPSSMHSITNRSDTPMLRPHPLIRGPSNNPITSAIPLAPLTITSDSTPAQLSASPPVSAHLANTHSRISSSPTRVTGSQLSPPPSPTAGRRTSISSARSVATLPVTFFPSTTTTKDHSNKVAPDRHRTLSGLSSAALSSLAHLPATSRPVTPQLISFFPPLNPHVHLELVHPLLPPPYLQTHMTVLSHRTPLRESFDRVIRAKQGR